MNWLALLNILLPLALKALAEHQKPKHEASMAKAIDTGDRQHVAAELQRALALVTKK